MASIGATGRFPNRVVHADADLGERKVRPRPAIHLIFEGAVGESTDRCVPREGDRPGPVLASEMDAEGVRTLFHGKGVQRSRDGVPVQVPDRDVDAPNYFRVADSRVAQVAVDEFDRDRTCLKASTFRRRRVPSVPRHERGLKGRGLRAHLAPT